jgi:hypothetical protein
MFRKLYFKGKTQNKESTIAQEKILGCNKKNHENNFHLFAQNVTELCEGGLWGEVGAWNDSAVQESFPGLVLSTHASYQIRKA